MLTLPFLYSARPIILRKIGVVQSQSYQFFAVGDTYVELIQDKFFYCIEETSHQSEDLKSQWVSKVLKYPKKGLEDLAMFFMYTWWGNSKNMEAIEFSWWPFEGRLRQGKIVLPDGLNWLCYFVGSSKSHHKIIYFFHIFGIPLLSRHKKHCQILQTLFWVFQYSRNSQCVCIPL